MPTLLQIPGRMVTDELTAGDCGQSGIASANRNVWFLSDTGTTLAGSLVSDWVNQGLASFSVAQATSDNQPTLVANIMNGHPVIRFDGNDHLGGGDSGTPDLSGASATFFAVFSFSDAGSLGHITNHGQAGSGTRGWNLGLTTGPVMFVNISSNGVLQTIRNSNTTLSIDTTYILGVIYDGAAGTLDIYLDGTIDNGTLTGSIPATMVNGIGSMFVGQNGSGGSFFVGDIAELLFYQATLSTAAFDTVIAYLKCRYNVT